MNGESPPEIKPARRGYSVRYKDKTLLSTVDPVAQAERVVSQVQSRDRTLYIIPSPLFGYGIEILLGSLKANSAVLCIETDPQLFSLSRSSIDETILNHPRFALTGISDGAELCRYVRQTWGPRVFRRAETVNLSGGWQLDGAAYETMAELLRGEIAVDWGNAMTLVKLGRRFIANALRNLAMLNRCRPITALSFGSKPALVLGAGPSLDPFLDALQASGLLNRNPRPFVIVCADTCLSLLRERNIAPDLTLILESQFWNMGDFTGLQNSGLAAAVDLSAYPPSATILRGNVFFFFTPWTRLRFFDRMNTAGLLPPALPPLGSVGLSAVEMARRLGSGPVLTAGIDFSFTLDKTHARSSPAHLASLIKHNRFKPLLNPEAAFREGAFPTTSKSNVPVRSNPSLRNYRNLFEQEFSADPRIFDIDGTGLSLGVKTLSMEEALTLLSDKEALTQSKTTDTSMSDERTDDLLAPNQPDAALKSFIKSEISLLEELRAILTGESGGGDKENESQLDALLDNADYLWAHFPDSAATEGRRPAATDVSFLKRVRTEIDLFLALWGKVLFP
jgi:hypothetical protein